MSASFFDRNKSGGVVARLISDIELAQGLVGSALTDVWMDFTALIVILYFLLRIDPGVTLAALVTFPFSIYYFRKSQRDIKLSSHKVQEEIAAMSGNVQEKIAGSQEKTEEKAFLHDAERLLNTTLWRVYLQSVNITVTGLITQLAPLIVMLYGGWRVIEGTLTVGELVAVGMYLTPLYTPMQRFAQLNLVFANSMAAVDRVFEIMDQKPEIRDTPGAMELLRVQGCVEFDRVHFAYPNVDEPGQKVALVGPSPALSSPTPKS